MSCFDATASHDEDRWFAVWSIALGSFVLVFSEVIPVITALGGAPFWIGFFVPELLLTAGALTCSIRVSRSTVSSGFRLFGFVLLIIASAVSVLVAGLLWLGIISIADIATAGEVPVSFTDLYFLQIVLAALCAVGLIGSTVVFRNATSTRPPSAAMSKS